MAMIPALRLMLPAAEEDRAATALWELGTVGFECRPAGAKATEILAHFSHEQPLRELQEALSDLLPGIPIECVELADVDWVARFRESFRPFEAGSFAVVPAWDVPDSPPDRTLVVDPGRAFGTGTHESTRLSLGLLESLARASPLGRVVDIGTGTAILAIAASKLGATLIVGSDIDPEAVTCASRHLALNEMPTPVRLALAPGARAFLPRRFDTLLANLSLPLLTEHADDLGKVFARHAILAGFLVADLPELREAFAHVDAEPEVATLGEWAALLLRQREPVR